MIMNGNAWISRKHGKRESEGTYLLASKSISQYVVSYLKRLQRERERCVEFLFLKKKYIYLKRKYELPLLSTPSRL